MYTHRTDLAVYYRYADFDSRYTYMVVGFVVGLPALPHDTVTTFVVTHAFPVYYLTGCWVLHALISHTIPTTFTPHTYLHFPALRYPFTLIIAVVTLFAHCRTFNILFCLLLPRSPTFPRTRYPLLRFVIYRMGCYCYCWLLPRLLFPVAPHVYLFWIPVVAFTTRLLRNVTTLYSLLTF